MNKKKICIFIPNWVGDVVMATPVLKKIRKNFGDTAFITAVGRPFLFDLFSGSDFFDELYPFDPKSSDKKLGRWSLVTYLRQNRYDAALLLTNSFSTALLPWLGGVKERIGLAMHGRNFLLSKAVHPIMQGRKLKPIPMVEIYVQVCNKLLETYGKPSMDEENDYLLSLANSARENEIAEKIWHDLGLQQSSNVVAINAGGAYGSAKRWSNQHVADLARRIAQERGEHVLIICGPKESDDARNIVKLANNDKVYSMADAGQPISLATTKAVLSRVSSMISTDSGPPHIACAFGKPVWTLLGPTLSTWIENPSVTKGGFISLNLECTGCAKRVCPKGHNDCMQKMTPDFVFEKIYGFANRRVETDCEMELTDVSR